ncbi:hypothetical protein [Thiomicrorhabdus hydrogeniphila]
MPNFNKLANFYTLRKDSVKCDKINLVAANKTVNSELLASNSTKTRLILAMFNRSLTHAKASQYYQAW